MSRLNVRMDANDDDRISFLREYLTQEGISFGPCCASEALRYALRQTVNAICKKMERITRANLQQALSRATGARILTENDIERATDEPRKIARSGETISPDQVGGQLPSRPDNSVESMSNKH